MPTQRPNVGGLGSKMAGGNPDPERGRAKDDFYATPPDVTRALFAHYSKWLRDAVVWECCAGDGAMAMALLECGVPKVVCTDIAPQGNHAQPFNILKGDILQTKRWPTGVDAVITNPPFNLAVPMINHILRLPGSERPWVAMVLKSTFWHARSRSELFREFRPSAVHPLRWRPDFKNLGAPTMEIMWCVWDMERPGAETVYEPFDRPDVRAR